MTFGVEKPLLEQLAERKVPLVFVDVGPERPGISLLRVDYRHCIRQGVQHLAVLGASGYCVYQRAQAAALGAISPAAFSSSLEECGYCVQSGVARGRGPHPWKGASSLWIASLNPNICLQRRCAPTT